MDEAASNNQDFKRGVLAALGVFERMWSSGDWEGQVSMGFASTFDQEICERLLWVDEKPGHYTVLP